MAVLLLIAAVGYFCGRAGKMDAKFCSDLSWLNINITSFPMIVGGALNTTETIPVRTLLLLLAAAFAAHIIAYLIALAVTRIFRVKTRDRGTAEFMLTFGNLIFIGYPVLSVLYGGEAIVYATVFAVPLNLFGYSVGALMVGRGGKKLKLTVRMFLCPPMIATIIGILIVIFRPPVPQVIGDTFTMLGGISVPSAMLIIGASMSASPLKQLLTRWKTYIIAIAKLTITPAAVFFILRLFIDDPLIIGISTVMAATPIAVISTMLCIQYDGNSELSSSGVFVSTLLSAATIPLVCTLLLG